MRTTIEVDKDLLAEARELTGEQRLSVLVHEGLKALIERESARRLGRLGGNDPAASAERVRSAQGNGQQLPTRTKRPLEDVLAEIRAAQEARGHVPPAREEVDRYLEEERRSWDR